MAAKKKPAAKKKTSRKPRLTPSAVKRGLAATEVALPIDHETRFRDAFDAVFEVYPG